MASFGGFLSGLGGLFSGAKDLGFQLGQKLALDELNLAPSQATSPLVGSLDFGNLSPGATNLISGALPQTPELSVARSIDPSTLSGGALEGLSTLAGRGGLGSPAQYGIQPASASATFAPLNASLAEIPDERSVLQRLAGGASSALEAQNETPTSQTPQASFPTIPGAQGTIPDVGGFGNAGTTLAELLPQPQPEQSNLDRLALARSLAARLILGGGGGTELGF